LRICTQRSPVHALYILNDTGVYHNHHPWLTMRPICNAGPYANAGRSNQSLITVSDTPRIPPVDCSAAFYGIKDLISLQNLLHLNPHLVKYYKPSSPMPSSSFYADAVLFDMASLLCYLSAISLTSCIASGRHTYRFYCCRRGGLG